MNAKTGKPYEKLAQAVFQSIVNQSDVPNVVVQHDVTLMGKHNSHQIDVYWKFAVDRLEYETVVEAKDWKDPVDQGELFKFKTVLEDLLGQPKGIFVSRTGYQQGAIDFALAHGILIYELREADHQPPVVLTTTGWAHFWIIGTPLRGTIATEGETIPKVYGTIWAYEVFTPEFSNLRFDVSPIWFQSERPTTDVTKMGELNIPSLLLHEINLYDEKRTVIGNLATIFQQVAQDVVKEGVEQKRATHAFKQPTFVQTDSLSIPYVKVEAVSVDVKIGRRHESRRGSIENFPQWVLRQLNSGSTDWFAVTPSVTSLLPSKKMPRKAS